MKELVTSSERKTILLSKRANLYYLEKCRVLEKDGRVLYLTEDRKECEYYNIPIANTTVLLLGMGTSITQRAVRSLVQAGVMIGFCGTGGTPLFAGTEAVWRSPQSEYRPTQYVQGWLSFWYDDAKRLEAARILERARIRFLQEVWNKESELQEAGFYPDDAEIQHACDACETGICKAGNGTDILVAEARFAKSLYHYAAERTEMSGFSRDFDGGDETNRLLNHGNYLAYGLGASALWVLGIPHGFPLLHGKTRRGALVFDIADLVKDTLVLPFAFICADAYTHEEFREHCLEMFARYHAIDFMIDTIKDILHQLQRKEEGGASS